MEEGNGMLFEVGPDGFCYLIDCGHEGRAYAIHISAVKGVQASCNFVDLENTRVNFTLENGGPTNIRIGPLAEKMRAAGGQGGD